MDAVMRRCTSCGEYTLRKDYCPRCGGPVKNPHPPRYSPEDKYGMYRLMMRIISGELRLSEEALRKILQAS